MPKALFFNVPGHGHVNPSLPLVVELTRRGHQVVYFATERYRASIAAAGAAFRAYSGVEDDYFESRGLSGAVPMQVAHTLVATSEAILPELLEITKLEKPDYILFDGMCPWGALVAKITGLPSVASLALPPMISLPPGAILRMLPSIFSMILPDIGDAMKAGKKASALAKQYGLKAYSMTDIMNNTGDIAISYTSTAYQPYADTVADNVRFVGWTLNNAPDTSGFSFERVGNRPLVYVSLGTLNNDDTGFFRACIDAFKGGEVFVMLSTGNRIAPETFDPLPENVAVYRWVPQVEVLKRAALFISHGGLNSVHDALSLSVPLLLVPQQAEQTMNSQRVVELGAGLLLKKSQVSASALHECAERLLKDHAFKAAAQRTGDTLRAAGGVVRAADEIEALLQQKTVKA